MSNSSVPRWLLLLLLLMPTMFVDFVSSSSACPNNCGGSSRGYCQNNRVCKCHTGFAGADCSRYSCPNGTAWTDIAYGNDLAHAPAVCSNRGRCDPLVGSCLCVQGFVGAACERLACQESCIGRGRCVSLKHHAQTQDLGAYAPVDPTGVSIVTFEGDTSTVVLPKYETVWDAEKLHVCSCGDQYYGARCENRECPRGDDPGTVSTLYFALGKVVTPKTPFISNSPDQVDEIQKIACTATGGSLTIKFRGSTTRDIPYNTKAIDVCEYLKELPTISDLQCASEAQALPNLCGPGDGQDGQGPKSLFTFTQQFGLLPLMTVDISKLTVDGTENKPVVSILRFRMGTKENDYCSNKGLCDRASGFCNCANGYMTSDGRGGPGTRGDCGFLTSNEKACPGIVPCSAHGRCSSDAVNNLKGTYLYRCMCEDTHTGSDCSERTCPKGKTWFGFPTAENEGHQVYTECSDAGTCDKEQGYCNCLDMFTGAACEKMRCPATDGKECSGHGACLDMQDASRLANINGENAGFVYGTIENDPVTWDAKRMMHCHCEEGYTGASCSERICPFGDNPDTRFEAFDEVQQITCQGSTGSVKIRFRDQVTTAISPQASPAALKDHLEALSTIRVVHVREASGVHDDTAVFCSASAPGTTFNVTFATEHGDLPPMRVHEVTGLTVSVSEAIKGTKENIICSGRGNCDENTGLCSCFTGYAASDAMGGSGSIPDCGHSEGEFLALN